MFTLSEVFGIFRALLSVKLHLTGNECIQLPQRKSQTDNPSKCVFRPLKAFPTMPTKKSISFCLKMRVRFAFCICILYLYLLRSRSIESFLTKNCIDVFFFFLFLFRNCVFGQKKLKDTIKEVPFLFA